MIKKLTIFGAFGALTYVLHVLLGGWLWEGYNHLHQPISDLTASGAPDRGLLNLITLFYGVFSIIFSVCAYSYMKTFALKVSRIGMLLFLFMQIISLTYGLFPQDMPGAAVTVAGIMHLVVTALIIPLTILAPILVGKGFRNVRDYENYGNYSIITGVIILTTGATAAIFYANKLPFFGLIERLNIVVVQLWMFTTSLRFFAANADIQHDKKRVGAKSSRSLSDMKILLLNNLSHAVRGLHK